VPRLGRISVLVVSWNGREHLETCLSALLAQRGAGAEVEILVLDNGSTDGTGELVRSRFPGVRLVEAPANLGFAAGNNLLAGVATGDALALVNNDTRAEPGWLAALADAWRSAPDDVAAVGGRIVDWDGGRLDFGRGILAFDGHALALDQGRPLAAARLPASGDELLFACGGNLLVGAAAFRAAGGFDERYFAYFEDVDLGWRLWSGGERVVACAEAVVRHRLSATSARLGNRRRGALFERNAFWTMAKNLEPGLRERLLPAILLTFLSRLEATLAEEARGPELLRGAPPVPRESWGTRLRRHGPVGSARRGGARLLRGLAAALAPGAATAAPLAVGGDRALAQLAALSGLLAELDAVEADRAAVAARRRRSDRELFERFPLWIVPAYPGDGRLFASAAFASWLPADLRFERAALADVLGSS
jgi:GT2 family glycosyltransferase